MEQNAGTGVSGGKYARRWRAAALDPGRRVADGKLCYQG